MLQRLKAKGITIFVSTPYMDEASLCDRVALIQNGQILQIDTPQQIINNFQHPLLAIRSEHMYQLIQDLRNTTWTHSAFPFGEFIHLATKAPIAQEKITSYLQEKGHQNLEIKSIGATIEDCFMELMSALN